MYLLVLHDKNGYTNASNCYLIRTQAALLNPINSKIGEFSVHTKTTEKPQYVEEVKFLSPFLPFYYSTFLPGCCLPFVHVVFQDILCVLLLVVLCVLL